MLFGDPVDGGYLVRVGLVEILHGGVGRVIEAVGETAGGVVVELAVAGQACCGARHGAIVHHCGLEPSHLC